MGLILHVSVSLDDDIISISENCESITIQGVILDDSTKIHLGMADHSVIFHGDYLSMVNLSLDGSPSAFESSAFQVSEKSKVYFEDCVMKFALEDLCPMGWKPQSNGKCFKEIMEPKTWDDAELDCTVQGAHLATLDSEEHNLVPNYARDFWIGAKIELSSEKSSKSSKSSENEETEAETTCETDSANTKKETLSLDLEWSDGSDPQDGKNSPSFWVWESNSPPILKSREEWMSNMVNTKCTYVQYRHWVPDSCLVKRSYLCSVPKRALVQSLDMNPHEDISWENNQIILPTMSDMMYAAESEEFGSKSILTFNGNDGQFDSELPSSVFVQVNTLTPVDDGNIMVAIPNEDPEIKKKSKSSKSQDDSINPNPTNIRVFEFKTPKDIPTKAHVQVQAVASSPVCITSVSLLLDSNVAAVVSAKEFKNCGFESDLFDYDSSMDCIKLSIGVIRDLSFDFAASGCDRYSLWYHTKLGQPLKLAITTANPSSSIPESGFSVLSDNGDNRMFTFPCLLGSGTVMLSLDSVLNIDEVPSNIDVTYLGMDTVRVSSLKVMRYGKALRNGDLVSTYDCPLVCAFFSSLTGIQFSNDASNKNNSITSAKIDLIERDTPCSTLISSNVGTSDSLSLCTLKTTSSSCSDLAFKIEGLKTRVYTSLEVNLVNDIDCNGREFAVPVGSSLKLHSTLTYEDDPYRKTEIYRAR
eukprot:scaffold76281_cov61-Attheya_sp.AAC.3